MSTRRRPLAALLATLVVALLAACTGLPTSGTVQLSNVQVTAAPDIDVLAEGPQPGADPHAIVESFLLAQAAGFGDNFAVAREYLLGDARAAWKPLAGVVVAGAMTISAPRDGEVSVDVTVAGRVDGDGVYAEAASDARETVTFGMIQDAKKEWRIASAPDGIVLSAEDFRHQFRQASVYFLSPDKTYLVPDTRWLPTRNLPTAVMDALLAGPADWLRDGVATAVPDGVQLQPESVVIDTAGHAQVKLGPAASVTRADRPLLLAQIDASLGALPSVFGVDVTSGGVPLEDPATLAGGPDALPAAPPLEYLANGALMQVEGASVSPVRGLGSLEGLEPTAPAVGTDGTRVVVAHGTSLVTVPSGAGEPVTLFTADQVLPPSVDRLGWAWTSDGTQVVAVKPGREAVRVRADWLADRVVRSVRVAADGARIAIASAGSDGVRVDVAAITRDDASVPGQLGAPIRAGASLTDATQVVWSDEATLAVLGQSPSGSALVSLVPVAGPTTRLPQVADAVALAAGPVPVVATKDGGLQRYGAPSWVTIAGVTGASFPYFPG